MICPHQELSVNELIVILAAMRLMRVGRRYWIEYDGNRWTVIDKELTP